MRRNTSTYLAGIVCAAILLFLGPGRPCHGQGLLPFQFDPNGAAGLGTNSDLSYDASTGEFRGTSLPLTLSSSTLPGGDDFVRFSGNPLLSFDLFVNPDGTFRSNGSGFDLTGTLSIGGTDITGTLLSGDFTAFGAEPASPPTWVANALFDTTGGLLGKLVSVHFSGENNELTPMSVLTPASTRYSSSGKRELTPLFVCTSRTGDKKPFRSQ